MNQDQDSALQVPPGKIPLDYAMYLRGTSNVELAERLGVSKSEVTRMRQGMRPNEKRRKQIARFLKVSQADLGWETEPANA